MKERLRSFFYLLELVFIPLCSFWFQNTIFLCLSYFLWSSCTAMNEEILWCIWMKPTKKNTVKQLKCALNFINKDTECHFLIVVGKKRTKKNMNLNFILLRTFANVNNLLTWLINYNCKQPLTTTTVNFLSQINQSAFSFNQKKWIL